MYFDAHIHLLPNMDNGPSETAALDMLRVLRQEACRMAIVTPHYYADHETVTAFLRKRRESYRSLLVSASLADIRPPKLLLSAEVLLCPDLAKNPDLERLTIPGTPYLPLELPLGALEAWQMREISHLLHKRHFRLLICHLERYYFMYKPEDYQRLCSLPNTVYQVSAPALCQPDFAREVMRLMLAGKTVLLGSNAHNQTDRPPIHNELVNKITNLSGETVYKALSARTVEFLRVIRA